MILSQPRLYQQSPGDAGTFQTVGHMVRLVNDSFLDPTIRERAVTIVDGCKRNLACEHRQLVGYVNRAVQFVRDPNGVEALHHPVTYFEANLRKGIRPAGDCDDLSMYLAALMKSIGHKPSFKIIDRFGDRFHHVLVYCDGSNLDATLSGGGFNDKTLKRVKYFEI